MNDADSPHGDFHSYSARWFGLGIACVYAVVIAFVWSRFDEWYYRLMGIVLASPFLYMGLESGLAPGKFRSWFANGKVHWEFPSRRFGSNDSCAIADIAELCGNRLTTSSQEVWSYEIVLTDGTRKPIGRHCIGDAAKFLDRLREENPHIEYRETTGKTSPQA